MARVEEANPIITLLCNNEWQNIDLYDGDKIIINIQDQELTYVLQPGDVNNLRNSGNVLIHLNSNSAIGVSYNTTANNFFNKLVIRNIVSFISKDAAGNISDPALMYVE